MTSRQSHVRFSIVRGLELEALEHLHRTTKDAMVQVETRLELNRRNGSNSPIQHDQRPGECETLSTGILNVLALHSGTGMKIYRVAEYVGENCEIIAPILEAMVKDGLVEAKVRKWKSVTTYKLRGKD